MIYSIPGSGVDPERLGHQFSRGSFFGDDSASFVPKVFSLFSNGCRCSEVLQASSSFSAGVSHFWRMFMFSFPALKNIPSVLTLSFTELGQVRTPVIVFEIVCHHSIETFSSVFSQGTTYLVMIVLMHDSIPTVTILPGMPPTDDLKFSFLFPTGSLFTNPGHKQDRACHQPQLPCFGCIIKITMMIYVQ